MSKRSKRNRRRQSEPQVRPDIFQCPDPSEKNWVSEFWKQLTSVCAGLAAILAAIKQIVCFFW